VGSSRLLQVVTIQLANPNPSAVDVLDRPQNGLKMPCRVAHGCMPPPALLFNQTNYEPHFAENDARGTRWGTQGGWQGGAARSISTASKDIHCIFTQPPALQRAQSFC
jgi:hypothetical protein